MKIFFLTTEDPIYLPDFFRRVLARLDRHTLKVYSVPPLYKKQTLRQAAMRYWRTFGTSATAQLTSRLLGAKVYGQSIASECSKRNVPYEFVLNVNAPDFLARLRREGPDLLVSVSCPQIFKKLLIELPDRGIINIHGAILPQYRGVMPSFWMLANGEKEAGVSIYFVNEAIDAGELCGQRIFGILPEDTLDSFIRRSKTIAADLLVEVVTKIEHGTETRTPLNLSTGSYYSWPNDAAVQRFRAARRRVW